MPKRSKRLSLKARLNASRDREDDDGESKEVSNARGRLKGVLGDITRPDDYDSSTTESPIKRRRRERHEDNANNWRNSPPHQSYVLKLFDRSVDLSQFSEDSPLYPICRAWMINQPKMNYKEYRSFSYNTAVASPVEGVELPGPDGPPAPPAPPLLPAQLASSKDNIALDYDEASLPSKEELLSSLGERWRGVRAAWARAAARAGRRHARSQAVLDAIAANMGY